MNVQVREAGGGTMVMTNYLGFRRSEKEVYDLEWGERK